MLSDRRLRPALLALLLAAGVAGASSSQPLPPVVVSGPPVAPPIDTPGTGLCAATSISTSPGTDFPQNASLFNAGMNAFMEANAGNRVTSVLRTVFDLSNNNTTGGSTQYSYGDFRNSDPNCKIGGCDFAYNDTTTSFGSRFRGYLNVTQARVGQPLHFGFFTDDAVSLTIFDKNQTAYPVITRPPVLGAPDWRSTNSVTFGQPGLYPVEILYAQIVTDAALELSTLDAPFNDFELPVGQIGSVSLAASSFILAPATFFFQTESGGPSFPDVTKCQQCNRQFANLPGNGGCGGGYYCNAAALCAPCDSAVFCGPTCSPCGQTTPFCINLNGTNTCVQCTKKADCGGQVCDLTTHTCKQCNVDSDCPAPKVCNADAHTCVDCNEDAQCGRGTTCQNHACAPCATKDSCAGVSCNCCPGGSAMKCEALTPGAMPSCVECVRDSDCGTGLRCDTVNGRCVASIPQCNTPDQCGPECAKCPTDRPYCQDGQVCVQCRSDFECGDGQFCISGECSACATDRHCGLRCATCGGDTPFCVGDGTAAHSACVRCRSDADCTGGTCDPDTHQCSSACPMSCAPGAWCDGRECVDCYAGSQCPCGGSCDSTRHTCTSACNDSGDCASNQHCAAIEKTCQVGRVQPDTQPRGGGLCCGATGPGAFSPVSLLAFGAMLRLLRPRRRAPRRGSPA